MSRKPSYTPPMWFGTISFAKSAAGEGLVGHVAGGDRRIGRELAGRKELKKQIGDAPPVLEIDILHSARNGPSCGIRQAATL